MKRRAHFAGIFTQRAFDVLRQRFDLGVGSRVLEIGPGTGQATMAMLELGATVTAVVRESRWVSESVAGPI